MAILAIADNVTLPAAIDGSPGSNVRFPPVRTSEGELLLPAYDDLLHRSLFFASADGQSWALRSTVATELPFGAIQPSVARLESGRLMAVLRNTGQQFLWTMASDDSGRTWSPPMNANFANPDSPACLLRLADGRLLLVFNDSAISRHPLSATISEDDGRSWTMPHVLVDGDGNYAYPSAVQASDGLVHILYSNDRANITEIVLSEAWMAGP
jgi:predicted neuraminidase